MPCKRAERGHANKVRNTSLAVFKIHYGYEYHTVDIVFNCAPRHITVL